MKSIIGLIGAVIGGLAGYFITGWLARQGLYSVLVPGALIGIGSLFGRFRNATIPIILALCAVAAVYYTEWRYFPFSKDKSLSYFISNLTSLRPLTHVMAAIGGVISFWLPFQKSREK
ncbi:MAG: hypothetical protein P1V20_19515 [Verrucomicrobiales bacterium]|nr:hypothetical protein [Verrucomicrobiales bacterium]